MFDTPDKKIDFFAPRDLPGGSVGASPVPAEAADATFLKSELMWIFWLTIASCGSSVITFAAVLAAIKYGGWYAIIGAPLASSFLVATVLFIRGVTVTMDGILKEGGRPAAEAGGTVSAATIPHKGAIS